MLPFIEETSGKLRYFHIRCWQHQSSTPIIFRYNWEVAENLSIITSKLPQLLRKTLPHCYWQSHTDQFKGSASYNSSGWEPCRCHRKQAISRIPLFRRRGFVKHLAFWLKIWSVVGLKKINQNQPLQTWNSFPSSFCFSGGKKNGRASPLVTIFSFDFLTGMNSLCQTLWNN